MQRFSWRTSTVRAAGANVKCWRNKPIGEFGAFSSGKFFKLIKLSEMQFPAFPGPELVNREGLLKH